MKQAVIAAIKRHPLSSVGTAQQQVGEAYRSQANALFAGDPSYNLSYYSDRLDSNRGFREFEGSLDFPLWRKGQKKARLELASSIVSRAKAEQLFLAWTVSGEVLERAWSVRIAQMEVVQAKTQQQSARLLEADVKRRVDAGEIARADLLLAQQSTAQTNLDYQQAVAKEALARNRWQTYTGFSRLPGDLDKQSLINKHLAHTHHPHVVASKARIAEARASRKNVRKQRRDNPIVSVYAKRDRGLDTDPFNNALGVGISLPFGTKSSSAPRLAEANANVVELLAKEAERERVHQQDIQQTKLAIIHARKALILAKQQNQIAQKRWKLSKRAFELGESDLFLVIRAREQANLQARTVKRNQLELSLFQARLNHINGAIPL